MRVVASNYSCKRLYTRFYRKKIEGVLRLNLMWFGRPFGWASRNLISLKIWKTIQVTRHCPDFWEHLGLVLLASNNTGWIATVRVITLNFFQSPQIFFKRYQIKNKEQCVMNYCVIISIALRSYTFIRLGKFWQNEKISENEKDNYIWHSIMSKIVI